jgi:hypothetical protein
MDLVLASLTISALFIAAIRLSLSKAPTRKPFHNQPLNDFLKERRTRRKEREQEFFFSNGIVR